MLATSQNLVQTVKINTRENRILDKCFTNMHTFYTAPEVVSQMGKSDHFAVISKPNKNAKYNKGAKKTKIVRASGKNEKALFAQALKSVNWSELYHLQSCREQFDFFDNTITHLLSDFFPLKTTTVHTKDKPWVTPEFKQLIKRRQYAKLSGDNETYKCLRNRINKQSKKLRPKFYKNKVQQLATSDSRQWWRHVKELVGLSRSDPVDTFTALANENANGDVLQLASLINEFFHSVSADLTPITTDNTYLNIQPQVEDKYLVSVEEVEKQLMCVKTGKAAGPDGIQAWMLRDLAPYFAPPVAAIFNSSIRESYIPDKWKAAIVSPLPKKSPPKIIEKDIRPISLTCILAKELERIVIKHYKIETKDKIDPMQFGNKQGVSTTHMLIKLLHEWQSQLDLGHSVRVVFLDYSKAFDRVNHNILLDKLAQLNVSPHMLKWFASFLINRTQCVKLGDATTTSLTMNGAVPQGALFGMEGFLALINDLKPPLPLYKYVDDSTTYDIIKKSSPDNNRLQHTIDMIAQWTVSNDMKINAQKTNEMLITFSKNPTRYSPIKIGESEIERVSTAKLVGLHIQDNLKWDTHVTTICKKARSKLHFLQQLKRSGVPRDGLLTFHKSVITPQLEYACPAWSTSLTKEQCATIESIQKRALKIIVPNSTYADALIDTKLLSLEERRTDICRKFFKNIQDPNNVLHNMLPPKRSPRYTLRNQLEYPLPKVKTNRYKNSFIPYCLFNFQQL